MLGGPHRVIDDVPSYFELCLELFHRALHQLLRVVELLEHERDVHLRLAGKSLAPAVDAVLTDERERVGQQIERDGEPPARRCPSSSRDARACRGACRRRTWDSSA